VLLFGEYFQNVKNRVVFYAVAGVFFLPPPIAMVRVFTHQSQFESCGAWRHAPGLARIGGHRPRLRKHSENPKF